MINEQELVLRKWKVLYKVLVMVLIIAYTILCINIGACVGIRIGRLADENESKEMMEFFNSNTVVYKGTEYYICDNTNCTNCFRIYMRKEPE